MSQEAKEQINQIFTHYQNLPSDINEHLETLSKFTSECSSVAELGVRTITSTWAFLKGLLESSNEGEKRLHCVDITEIPNIVHVIPLANAAGIQMTFTQHNSATVDLPEVDLLFIDTLHVYGHLKRELAHLHGRAKKYIVMHDTESDGIFGELLRMNLDIISFMKMTGYTTEDLTHGLLKAIYEFLHEHPEWKMVYSVLNNNGLMVLKRIS